MNTLIKAETGAALIGRPFAVRAIGNVGLDVMCVTVMDVGPVEALRDALERHPQALASARCWVVTLLGG